MVPTLPSTTRGDSNDVEMFETPQARRTAQIALLAIVGAAAVGRVFAHRGVTYSPADEQVYANYACTLDQLGLGTYPDVIKGYLADPVAQLSPSPGRWGFTIPNTIASEILGCGPSGVAWVSTLAGILTVALVAVMSYRLLGPRVAIVATLFVATSPLQLLIGRRALGDELVGLVSLAALWCVIRYADRPTWTRLIAAVLMLLWGFGTKEIYFLLYPALMAPLFINRIRARRIDPRDLVLLVGPVALSYLVSTLLSGSWGAYVDILRAVESSASSAYVTSYMGGPPYRLVLDLLTLAPAVVLLAVASSGLLIDRGSSRIRVIATCLVLSLVPFALIGAQVVRVVVVSDTLICMLAAWGVVAALRGCRWWLTVVVAGLAAAINVAVFWTISVRGEVYDPVSDNLLRALGIIP